MKQTAKNVLHKLGCVNVSNAKRKARMEAIRPIQRPNLARMYQTKAMG